MRTFFLSLLFFFCALINAQAQTGAFGSPYYCGNDTLLERMLNADTTLKIRIGTRQSDISARIALINPASLPVVTIPVVIHVISDPGNSATNISDQQIIDQIAALNNEFNVVNNTNIYFCLAQILPDQTTNWTPYNGNGTPGITRTSDARIANHNMDYAQGMLNSVAVGFDPARYMNIWVVATITGFTANVLGYAPRPIIPNSILDGIVIRYDVFGDNRSCNCYSLLGGYTEGKVLVHEAGHYLGLFHTFQNGMFNIDPPCQNNDCTIDGDMICDTPPASGPNYGTCIPSPPSINSCSTDVNLGDPNNPFTTDVDDDISNYMDYMNDDCKSSFTVNNTYSQAPRMHATIQSLRALLVSPENLAYTGVGSQCNGSPTTVLVPDFYIPETEVCTGGTLMFTPSTTYNTATTYSWVFPGGSPATSSSSSPVTVTYSSPGVYTVTLTVTDGSGSASASQTIYVAGCIVNEYSQSNWYFGDHASLLFTNSVLPYAPVPPPSAMYGAEGVISLSDGGGNPLFYSNGIETYEAVGHTTIAGGPMNGSINTQAPGNPYSLASASQGVVSFLDPGNSTRYYIFTAPDQGGTTNVLSYSVYDISGTYISTNTAAGSSGEEICEFITAIPDCANQGYWVLTHGLFAPYDDQLLAYHVTAGGVNTTPVTSASYTATAGGGQQVGQFDVTRDGSRFALATNDGLLQIYDFDKQSGTCTLVTTVSTLNVTYYGACFSPDAHFLYTIGVNNFGTELLQIDMTDIECGNQPQISHISYYGIYCPLNTLQLGPDDRIYITTMGPLSGDNKLSIINFPNQAGIACGFNLGALSMVQQQPRFGLPNMVDAAIKPTATIRYCVSNCQFQFSSTGCGTTYAWDFGDGVGTSSAVAPTYTYTVTGTYTVTLSIDGYPATPVVVNATGAPAIFAYNYNSPKEFVRIDPTNGSETQTIAVLTGLINSLSGSSTFDPNHNRFIFSAASSAGSFYNIDVTNGNVITASPADVGAEFEYDISNNKMYGINVSVNPRVFAEFDPITGVMIGSPIYTFPSGRSVVTGSSTYDQTNHVYLFHTVDLPPSGASNHYWINTVTGIVNLAGTSSSPLTEYEYNSSNTTLYSFAVANPTTPTIETVGYTTGAIGGSPVASLTGLINVSLGCTTFDPANNIYYLSGTTSSGIFHYGIDCTSGSVSATAQTNGYAEYEYAACAPACPTCRIGHFHDEQQQQAQATSEYLNIQPNPSGGQTTLAYQVAQEGKVTIDLVDITGKRVAQLLNGISQPAGDFQLQWNTAALAPGIYYCRLLTTSGQTNIKLIISR